MVVGGIGGEAVGGGQGKGEGGAGMSWCEAERELDAWFGFSLPGFFLRCARWEVGGVTHGGWLEAGNPASSRPDPDGNQQAHTPNTACM